MKTNSRHGLFALAAITSAFSPLMAADTDGVVGGGSDTGTVATNGKEMKYFFKTPVIRDNEGKEIGKGEKHPDVVAVLPVPTPLDIVNALSFYGETEPEVKEGKETGKQLPTVRGKVAQLIMDGITDLVFAAGRSQINDFLEKNENNPDARFTATNFDLSKLSLEFIAQQERAARGAWAPSDDDIKAFTEDYTNVFVHEINYDPKKVKVHGDQFAKGFSKIKADKIAVEKMRQFLTMWASKTANMDAHEAVYTWLLARADKYLKAEEKNFADAL